MWTESLWYEDNYCILPILCKQVDLHRPMLIHAIQTQGTRTTMGLTETFTMYYTISYSMDNEHWKFYRGNGSKSTKVSAFHPSVLGLGNNFCTSCVAVSIYIIVLHPHNLVWCQCFVGLSKRTFVKCCVMYSSLMINDCIAFYCVVLLAGLPRQLGWFKRERKSDLPTHHWSVHQTESVHLQGSSHFSPGVPGMWFEQ